MYKNDVIGCPNKDITKDQEKWQSGNDETAIGLQCIHNMLKEFNNAIVNELDSLEGRMGGISKVAYNTYRYEKESCDHPTSEPITLIEMIEMECISLESHFLRIKKLNDIVNTLLTH